MPDAPTLNLMQRNQNRSSCVGSSMIGGLCFCLCAAEFSTTGEVSALLQKSCCGQRKWSSTALICLYVSHQERRAFPEAGEAVVEQQHFVQPEGTVLLTQPSWRLCAGNSMGGGGGCWVMCRIWAGFIIFYCAKQCFFFPFTTQENFSFAEK